MSCRCPEKTGKRCKMPRYSRQQAEDHQRACDLAYSDRGLRHSEREFILEHWLPGMEQAKNAAFFTPEPLAAWVAFNAHCSTPASYVDLGAGIGSIAYRLWMQLSHDRPVRALSVIHCIESNPEYVAIGQRVLPEARWYEGSVFDPMIWMQIGDVVSVAVSNPPYGSTGDKPPKTFPLRHMPRHLQFAAVAVEHTICGGTFVLPSTDLPFRYSIKSQQGGYKRLERDQYSMGLTKLLDTYRGLRLGCIASYFPELSFDGAHPNVNVVDVNVDEMTWPPEEADHGEEW